MNRLITIVILAAILMWAVLAACNALLGELNQDEGWYLYAAHLTAQGRLPFCDYAFTQGPLLPLFYRFIDPLVRRWGLLAGRAFTALLGLLAAVASAALSYSLAGKGRAGKLAFALTFVLVTVNVHHSYFTTVVKTYSLAAFLLTLGLLLLAQERFPLATGFAGGVLLCLTAATRSSAAVIAPIVLVYLLVSRRSDRAARLAGYLFGGLIAAAVIFLPLFIAAPENMWFGLFSYHTLRHVGGPLKVLIFKAGFVSRLVQAYFVAGMLLLALFLSHIMRWPPSPQKAQAGNNAPLSRAAIWLSVLAVTATHFAAPFPYDDYQVFIYPAFAAVLAAAISDRISGSLAAPAAYWRTCSLLLALVFLVATAASLSSPINQSWVIAGRDRIWWLTKKEPDLLRLRRAARIVRELARDSALLLTQDTYLAVEAGMEVPSGLEMGPFSYFPDWSREKAERYHVLNRSMLREYLIQSPARVAAISGYGLSIRAPEIVPLASEERKELLELLKQRYRLVEAIPNFGQAHTTLSIYVLRETESL